MNPRRKRQKERRRARKLADQAWEAADEGNLNLAVKIVHRAVDLDPSSPALWLERGMLLEQAGQESVAEASLRAAILLAPDYAEAYALLASLRARADSVQESVALQRQAVRHAPRIARYADQLAAYESLLGESPTEPRQAEEGESLEQRCRTRFPELARRVDAADWPAAEQELTARGYTVLPGLLDDEKCAELRSMFHDDDRFAKTVSMDKDRFGSGVYRYLRSPLPPLIDSLRRLVYPPAAEIANRWQELLGKGERFPDSWESFRLRCADAGQSTPTPLLLRYEKGGFNAPHRDIRGDVFFPLQLMIVLSRLNQRPLPGEGFTGGEFLFCDEAERRPARLRRVAAGQGDAVLFCTCWRLQKIAGVHGLRSVKHGVHPIESGIRYALATPFHEYA